MKGATSIDVLKSKKHVCVRVSIYIYMLDCRWCYARVSQTVCSPSYLWSYNKDAVGAAVSSLDCVLNRSKMSGFFFFRSLSLSLSFSPARFKTVKHRRRRKKSEGEREKELKLNQSLLAMWVDDYVIRNKLVSFTRLAKKFLFTPRHERRSGWVGDDISCLVQSIEKRVRKQKKGQRLLISLFRSIQ